MLILASPRFLLYYRFSFSAQASTPRTLALLPRSQRMRLYPAQDTLRFPLSNRREYRTHRDCHGANPLSVLQSYFSSLSVAHANEKAYQIPVAFAPQICEIYPSQN